MSARNRTVALRKTGRWLASVVSFAYLLPLLAACSAAPPEPANPLEVATDKLVLYYDPRYAKLLDTAISKFKALYRDVDLEVVDFGRLLPESYENYVAALRADLMVGIGPDLVVLRRDVFPDIYKAIDSGVFDDLDPYLLYDKVEGASDNKNSIDISEYNQAVLDAGVYKGKRYVMPLGFYYPYVASTEELLTTNSLPPDGFLTFDQYLQALKTFAQTNGMTPFTQRNQQFRFLLHLSGIQMIDDENQRANTDAIRSDDFRNMIDTYKSYYAYDFVDMGEETEDADKLVLQERLFSPLYGESCLAYFMDCSMAYPRGATVPCAISGVDGETVARVVEFAAIRAKSENKVNAWRFIKILLSPASQTPEVNPTNFPVLNGVVRKYFEATLLGDLGPASSNYNNLMFLTKDRFAPPENFESFYSMIDSGVDRAVLNRPQIHDFLWECMKPYLDNAKDYESCLNDLINRLYNLVKRMRK